ncbi:MAG: hypothetical protein QM490_00560 [Candidatus Gracilibacteria bacterium]
MNVASGEESLEVVLENLKSILSEELNLYKNSNINIKVKPLFYETLLSKTFIFYIKKGFLRSSQKDSEFNEIYDGIISVGDIPSILIMYNLSTIEQRKYKMSWIAIEEYEENFSDNSVSKKSISEMRNHFEIISFLDVYRLENNKNERRKFRIDFEKLEKSIHATKLPLKLFLRNSKRYFYYDLLNIQKTDSQINEIPCIDQELINIKYDDIKITKKEHKNVYHYKCQICNKMHEVVLSKSQRDKNTPIEKYKHVSSDWILIKEKDNVKRVYIKCDHAGTEYENINFSFKVDNLMIEQENIDISKLNLDKIFLFQFYNFVHENNSIKYFKDREFAAIDVNEFCKRFK